MLELEPLHEEASPMAKRVAFYLRVSTGDGQQTIENQRRALDEIAQRACWEVVEIYADEISGTKGRWRPSPSQARSQCRQRGSKIRYLALK